MAQRGSRKLEVTLPSDTEIRYKRVFDAPKHLVFEAFTRPEHVRRWWCCMDGWTMTLCEIDLRVGGRWRYAMVGPDNAEVAFNGTYREIAAPDRLVHTEIFEMYPDTETVISAVLVERDDKAYYDAIQVFPNKESRDGAVASGMEVGADIAFDRLEEVARSMAGPAAAGGGVTTARPSART